MSLTSYMKDPSSPISEWLERYWDYDKFDGILADVNSVLARQPMVVDYEVDPLLIGTAFDYAFRWSVQNLHPYNLVAWHGMKVEDLENEKEAMTMLINQANNDPALRSRASIVLAWFEGIFRGQRYHERLKEARAQYSPFATPEAVLDVWLDVAKGRGAGDIDDLVETIPEVWGDRLQQDWRPNPTFSGSVDVGGADADWIFGDTLYDCKSSWKRKPFVHGMLQQVVCYTLLDYYDDLRIRNVGVYFPRHLYIYEVPLEQIWDDWKTYLNMRSMFERECAQLSDDKTTSSTWDDCSDDSD